MAFLDCAGPDWDIACTIVHKAREMKAEARRDELKAIVTGIGNAVGSRVAEQIGRMFR